MNILKKSFIGVSILFFFVLGIMLVPNEGNAAVTVGVTADSINVNYNGYTTIRWTSSTGVTSCTLRRSDTGANVSVPYPLGSYFTGALTQTTTFTVTCTSPDTYYYRLTRCGDNAIYQTGPFAAGRYSTGDMYPGYLDSVYYRIIGSQTTSYTDARNNITLIGVRRSSCP